MTLTKILCAALLTTALAARARAQTPKPTQTQTQTQTQVKRGVKDAGATKNDADPLAAERRARAVALLTSLANDAADFRDDTLRARAQARAADALWNADAELARTLFRRAWQAADSADRAAKRKVDEEIKEQLARHGTAMTSPPPELRPEVLRLAARRDRALGEELLALLSKSAEDEAGDAATKTANDAARAEDSAQRLGLARRLLEEGDTERALQFAEPALARVGMQQVAFLSALREKDAAAADRLYASLLIRAEADASSDANTVSILSSYLFTPFDFFTTYRGGGTGRSVEGRGAPPDVAPALRSSFMRAAARVLLRPPTTAEYERTSAGRAGTYIIIRRMLPLFEQHAPDLTPALNARASALLPDVPERARAAEAEGMFSAAPRREESSAKDEVREAFERAERTSGVAERDDIYAWAAVNASWKGDPRAEELLNKINDADLARRVRKFADFAFVRAALGRKETDSAVERARKGDLTRVERAWALERAAELLHKTDRARAVTLLEESAAEARRIDNTEPDRARALVAVATRYEKIDRARAWELLDEASRAAGSAPGFTGEDGKIVAQFRSNQGGWITDVDVEEFDLSGVLEALAADDWNRAAQLADSFAGEAARVTAVVTLARDTLVKKVR